MLINILFILENVIMKKGILLSLSALLLVGIIGLGIWYFQEKENVRADKDAFIPYNSAFVLAVNSKPELAAIVKHKLGKELEKYNSKLLVRMVDSLRTSGLVNRYPYVLAVRIQGKKDLTSLYVMDVAEVLSRSNISEYLNRVFVNKREQVRKYDHHKIHCLKSGEESVYFAICGSIVLMSDSDLYIEDGLKQYDIEKTGAVVQSQFRNIDKYFSAFAGVNVFMNTEMFTGVLPAWLEVRRIFPNLDMTRLFKWGALDGEVSEDGILLNGFMEYGGLDKSYLQVFQKQEPQDISIDKIIPKDIISLTLLNVSETVDYFTALDNYRYSTGKKDKVFARKQQYVRMFGKGQEEEWRKLLQGEFALVTLPNDKENGKREGLVIASLKSGSLAKAVLERMLTNYARFNNTELRTFKRVCAVDKGKSFDYYHLPITDLPMIFWGEMFDGVEGHYVFVEDNYLIFATSVKALDYFVKDYVHGNSLQQAGWYKNLRSKLSGKYNFAYFAQTQEALPMYKNWVKGDAKDFLDRNIEELSVFPALAMQWSNEGGLLYNTTWLSSKPIQKNVRPHILWQTRLDGKVAMKPTIVTNHIDGSREVFVQDDKNTIYLINDAGRILWKQVLDEKINSEVYQVDLYKNGKLQFLFSTLSKIYLIDRNGNAAGRFPLKLKSVCKQGMTLFDYDNNKDYRIFVPGEDQMVYLYDLDGNEIDGWKPDRADKPIVSKVNHFRIEGKDYLVFADKYRLYILDRRGKERIRVSAVFDLPEQIDICLAKCKDKYCLLFAGLNGVVNSVDISGKLTTLKVDGNIQDKLAVNVADIDDDGVDECIMTSGNRLFVYELAGNLVWEKSWTEENIGYPYIYRFSNDDMRIGLNGPVLKQLFLLKKDGEMTQGFPVSGDSPFSILFSGNDSFYLYAGGEESMLIKYRLLR